MGMADDDSMKVWLEVFFFFFLEVAVSHVCEVESISPQRKFQYLEGTPFLMLQRLLRLCSQDDDIRIDDTGKAYGTGKANDAGKANGTERQTTHGDFAKILSHSQLGFLPAKGFLVFEESYTELADFILERMAYRGSFSGQANWKISFNLTSTISSRQFT